MFKGKSIRQKREWKRLMASVAGAAILSAGLLLQTPANAFAEEQTYSFEIPSQSLGASLRQIALASNYQILFSMSITDGLMSKRVSGNYSVLEALDNLLEGTGLIYEITNKNVILIKDPALKGSSINTIKPTRVAQNNNDAPDTGNKNDNDDDDDSEPLTTETDAGDTEVVFVTGTNIRGVTDLAAPTINFTREEIDDAGFGTLEDLFASLPQNLSEIRPTAAFADGSSRIAGSNSQGAAGISLRGLGPGSTLVLLNGKRRAGSINGRVFDTSAIPLAAIERVEIITGGGSAIYGSDAVAGVVNLVTRRDFEGAETQVYFSNTSRGGDRFNVSQIFGHKSEKGGFVLAYDYARDWSLDATEAGRVASPPTGDIVPTPGAFFLAPDSKQHSVFFSGRFSPSDRVELYADALYTSDKNENFSSFTFFSIFSFDNFTSASSDQFSATAGARFDLNDAWQLDVSGTHSVVDITLFGLFNGPFGNSSVKSDDKAKMTQFTAVADGPLFSIGGGKVRAAVGIESRDESYERIDAIAGLISQDDDRSIRSVFGELIIPLVAANAERSLRGLEISLAARFDDYSDFGSTFDPQVGVQWGPLPGLVLRGAFSTAFRAPDLFTLGFGNQAFISNFPDPMAPSGSSTVLQWLGGNPDLNPEEATTWSIGFDFEPTFAPWAKISLSYYNINYTDRIDQPANGPDEFTFLENAAVFQTLINLNPSAAGLATILNSATDGFANFTGIPFDPATQNLLDVFPDIVVFDNRRSNIGVEAVSGLDLNVDTTFETNAGTFSAGLNGTYYFKLDRRITPTAPLLSNLNRQGKPTDLRLRASFSWTKGPYGAFAYLNYTDSYNNTLTTPVSKIKSWTTVDVTLRFDGTKLLNGGALEDFTVALSVSNLFNQDPPELLGSLFGFNFDGANASPLGRSVSLRLVKRW